MAIESNMWIFSLFGIGYHFMNRPSRVLTYLSQAAYPVYIIHMFALYAGSLIILPLQMPVMLKFVLIVVFTFAACYFIYEIIIRRIWVLRPFFGLKLKPRNVQGEVENDKPTIAMPVTAKASNTNSKTPK